MKTLIKALLLPTALLVHLIFKLVLANEFTFTEETMPNVPVASHTVDNPIEIPREELRNKISNSRIQMNNAIAAENLPGQQVNDLQDSYLLLTGN